ncbi:MAG: response regulator [Oscillospiraceae bacterium]|nr:response regulator [Oscillospiraceae bacterium]
MKIIFAVDDNEVNRISVKTALEKDYTTYALPTALKMFNLLEKITPDLILLDIDMPEMDGFEVVKRLKADPRYKPIPVIFLTMKKDPRVEILGFELGVIDFIGKPFSPPVLSRRIETHLEIDKLVKKSTKALSDLHNATISVISNLVESRDNITGKHIERTQEYLKILVDELVRTGVYAEEISGWNMSLLLPSAQLHDVGKITISDTVLNKPGKLDDEEFAVIKTHSSEGERIIEEIISKTEEDGFLYHAKRFAGGHHEKWNGTGYPRGLSGEDIPLEGRIMAIADVYDALVSKRPYKKAFTHEQAVDIIKKDSGTHFDPKVVEAFLGVADEFWAKSVELEHDK